MSPAHEKTHFPFFLFSPESDLAHSFHILLPRPATCSLAGVDAAPSLPPVHQPVHCRPHSTPPPVEPYSIQPPPPPAESFSAAPSVRRWSCRRRPNPTGSCPFRPRPSSSISCRCRWSRS